MDACHILLGRPWLFDRKVMHNGYLNTCSFTKDEKKITLTPLSPSQLDKKAPQKNPERSDLFLTFSDRLLKATHHKFQAFKEWILISQDESETSLVKHPLDVTLVHAYTHVFPEEIPAGLPPKWDIQHHVDLIPRAVLPNKPSYRINRKDTMEI